MILGIGTDIVNISRIEQLMGKHENRFITRHFSPEEQQAAEKHKENHDAYIRFFAKRFAAKEAFAKALGTGFRDGLYLKDISVQNDKYGRPYIVLSDTAQSYMAEIIGDDVKTSIHLSLSDDAPFAQAFVILEKKI